MTITYHMDLALLDGQRPLPKGRGLEWSNLFPSQALNSRDS